MGAPIQPAAPPPILSPSSLLRLSPSPLIDAIPPTEADYVAAGLTPPVRASIAAFSYASFCEAADALAAEAPGGKLPAAWPPLSPWQARHALLAVQAVPSLDEVRYVLVPSRLSDGAFWAAYLRLARPLLPAAAFDPGAPPPARAGEGEGGGFPAAGLGARLGAWAAAAAAGGASSGPPPSTSAGEAGAAGVQDGGRVAGEREEDDDLDRYLAELDGEEGDDQENGSGAGQGEGEGASEEEEDDLDAYLQELDAGTEEGEDAEGKTEEVEEVKVEVEVEDEKAEEKEEEEGGATVGPPPDLPASSTPVKGGVGKEASPVAVAASPGE